MREGGRERERGREGERREGGRERGRGGREEERKGGREERRARGRENDRWWGEERGKKRVQRELLKCGSSGDNCLATSTTLQFPFLD